MMQIPVSADEQLLEEQKAVVDFRFRKAQRVQQTVPFTLETEIRLTATVNESVLKRQ